MYRLDNDANDGNDGNDANDANDLKQDKTKQRLKIENIQQLIYLLTTFINKTKFLVL